MATETLVGHSPARWAALSRWFVPITVVALALGALGLMLDDFVLYVATSWIIFGIVALSLDLVWGKCGFLSFGQTAFYGLGGYVASVVAINFAPLTGNNLVWIIPIGAATGAFFSAIVGYFIFFGRISALQGTILTYTFTLILWTGSIGLTVTIGDAGVGGDNGMTSIPPLTLGFGQDAQPLGPFGMYLTTLTTAALLYLAVSGLLRRPFGRLVAAIRMDELKTELLGFDVRAYRLAVFSLGGAVAGIAGGLFASWATYINPTVFSIAEALLVPIYVLVGGRGTLVGGFAGAVAVGGLSFWLGGGVIGGQTTLALGIILILVVLFIPRGVIGFLDAAFGKLWPQTISPPRAVSPLQQSASLEPTTMPDTGETPSLVTQHLAKAFGGVLAINDVSVAFPQRGIRCLIGPNGAGKSTFLKLCAGLHRPDRGRIQLYGVDIAADQPFARVRAGLAIKMQVAQVFPDFSVEENLWLAGFSRSRNEAEAEAIVESVLPQIGLVEKRVLLGAKLSHGERQWLDIGMILCLAPKVILLDEPTAGMTKEETRQTADLIRGLALEAAVVVVEHDMEFVRMLDAEVTVLHQGAKFAEGRIEELRRDERVLDIYLGRRQSVKSL
jgi:branched-chain amino acid transport system permease protein